MITLRRGVAQKLKARLFPIILQISWFFMQLTKFTSATACLHTQMNVLCFQKIMLLYRKILKISVDIFWIEPLILPPKKHKAVSCPSTLTTVTKIECYLRIFEVFLCTSARYERSVSEAPLEQMSCKGLLLSHSWKDTLPTNIYFIPLQELFSSWPWVLQPRSWFKEISTLIWKGTQMWVKVWFLVSCLGWWVDYL